MVFFATPNLDAIFCSELFFLKAMLRMILSSHLNVPYIPEYMPRIFGGFYKAKVRGSAYIRVYTPQKKITS